MITLPPEFVETIRNVHQAKGELWLRNFGELVDYCKGRWSLKILTPFSLSYNFVAPAVLANGLEVVLKLCVPNKEVNTEIESLRLFNGNGIVQLIDSDEDRGILILDRLKPGNTLKSIADDDESTLIASNLIQKMMTPAPAQSIFPSTAQWSLGLKRLREHFNGGTGSIPERFVCEAESLYPKLNRSIKKPRLLHGDLHHENILSRGENWLAIDPKGLVGEVEYEVIPFLMNHLPEVSMMETIKRRVDIFVKELHLQRERVFAWSFCHAVLASWWCIEDGVDCVESFLQKARMFEKLMRN